jgi:hypothetical protein
MSYIQHIHQMEDGPLKGGYLNAVFWIGFGISLLFVASLSKMDQDKWQREYDDKCLEVHDHPQTDPDLAQHCKSVVEDNLMHATAGVLVWGIMGTGSIIGGMVFAYIQFRKDVETAQQWEHGSHVSPCVVENSPQQSYVESDPNFVPPIEERRTCTNCGTQTGERTCPNCGKPIG